MKTTKKLASVVLAMIMVLALTIPAMAAGDYSITISTDHDVSSNTYTLYKIFDATQSDNGAISYKVPAGQDIEDLEDIFDVDSAGNVSYKGTGDELTAGEVATIKAYVEAGNVSPITDATYTDNEDGSVTYSNLAAGYYYITTTTGTVVSINSTNADATVTDKNGLPTVTKTIEGKTGYGIGEDVTFSIDIEVKSGAVNYVLHDQMDEGLDFNNDSVEVTVGDSSVDTSVTTWWLQENDIGDDTFNIVFADAYVAGLADQTITVTYTATVIANLSATGASNSAWLTYGTGAGFETEPDTPETDVCNAKLTVYKVDGQGTETTDDDTALGGAQFILKKTVGGTAYYYVGNDSGDITAEDAAAWWSTSQDDAIKVTPDETGMLEFEGLGEGTYTLIEVAAPDGFNKAPDTTFAVAGSGTVSGNDVEVAEDNPYEAEVTVINNSGAELPSTGGIGTTIFTVGGSILMIGAAILFITKKRSAID